MSRIVKVSKARAIGARPADVLLHVADVEPRQKQAQEQEQAAGSRDDVSPSETLEVHGRDHIRAAVRDRALGRSEGNCTPSVTLIRLPRSGRNDRVGSATHLLVPPTMSDQLPARVERDGSLAVIVDRPAGGATSASIAARLEETRARTLLLIDAVSDQALNRGARPAHEPDRMGPGSHRHLRGPLAGAEPVRPSTATRRPRRRVRPVHRAAQRARRAALSAHR